MPETKKILVIDDELFVCRSVQKIFTREGMQVEIALNGTEGLLKVHGGGFDVVMVDVAMPEMNGFEVVRTIREISPLLPVVVMSGYNTPQIKTQAFEVGSCGFVAKPFTPEEVREMVLAVLKQQFRPFQKTNENTNLRVIETTTPNPTDLRPSVMEKAETPEISATSTRMSKKAIGYICPIPLDYADDIIGADEQKRHIEAYAKRNGFEIEAFYEDEGPSDDILHRPAMERIIESEKNAGVILVDRIWCLSRQRKPLIPFLETLDREGIKLEAAVTMMDCVSQFARHWHKNKKNMHLEDFCVIADQEEIKNDPVK